MNHQAASLPTVLVSACLAGRPVRWDGADNRLSGRLEDALSQLRARGRVVEACPELLGGLAVPRPPAECVGGDGDAVLDGTARVLTDAGVDVTDAFLAGARRALAAAKAAGATAALLKARSPSCGTAETYDGTFSGTRVPGRGVTAALLRRHGIAVFDESDPAGFLDWLETRP